MTALEAIAQVDGRKHNVCTREEKLGWLNQVERMAAQLLARCGLEPEDTPLTPETELTVQPPYDALYLRWLEAQIDYGNQEYLKYNNAMSLFTALWQEYANHIRREVVQRGHWSFF